MEVVALVISILALVVAAMTLPTMFQMVWGKPKIAQRFVAVDEPLSITLVCEVRNEPIRNGILKRLGIRRSPTIVTASSQLFEQGTNKPQRNVVIPHIITHDGHLGQRAIVESSISPITIPIAFVRKKDGKVFQYDSPYFETVDDLQNPLPIGAYTIKVVLTIEDVDLTTFKNLRVADKYPYAYWED